MARRALSMSSFSSSSCLRLACDGMQRALLNSSGRNSSGREPSNSGGSYTKPNKNNTGDDKSHIESFEEGRSSHSGSEGPYKRRRGSTRTDSGSASSGVETTGSSKSVVHMNHRDSSVVFNVREKSVMAEQGARSARGRGRGRGAALRRSCRLWSEAMPTESAVPGVAEAPSSSSTSGGEPDSSDSKEAHASASFFASRHGEILTAPAGFHEPPITRTLSKQAPSACNTCRICLETILATDRTVDLGCTRIAASSSSAPQRTNRASPPTCCAAAPSSNVSPVASASPFTTTAAASSGAAAPPTKIEQRSGISATTPASLRGVGRTLAAKLQQQQQQHAGRRPSEDDMTPTESPVAAKEESTRESLSGTTTAAGAGEGYEKHEFHAVCFRQYIIFSLQNVYATPIVKPTSAGRATNIEPVATAAAAGATETAEDVAGEYAGASIVQCPLPHCRREVSENIIRNLLVHPYSAVGSHCSSSINNIPNSSSADERNGVNESSTSGNDRKSSTSGDSSSVKSGCIRNSPMLKRRGSTSSSGSRRRGTERLGSTAAAAAAKTPIAKQNFRSSLMKIASSPLSRLGSNLVACLQKQLLQQQALVKEVAGTPANTATPIAAVQTTTAAATESLSTAASLSMEMSNVKGDRSTVTSKDPTAPSCSVDALQASVAARQRRRRSATELGGNVAAAAAPGSCAADSFARRGGRTGTDAAAVATHSSDKIKQHQQRDGDASSSSVPSTCSSPDTSSAVLSRTQSSCAAAAAAVGSSGHGRAVVDGSVENTRSVLCRSNKGRVVKSEKKGSSTCSGQQGVGSRRPSECELLIAGRSNSETKRNVEVINILSDGERGGEERGSFISVEEDTPAGDVLSLDEGEEGSATELNTTCVRRRSHSNTNSGSSSSSDSSSNHEKEDESSSEGATLYNMYLTRSFEAYADAAGDLVRCTTPGCGYAFWWPADDEWAADDDVGGEVCPKCRCRCLICGMQAHAQQSCEAAAHLIPVAEGQQQQKKKRKRTRSLSFWRRVRSLDLAFDEYKKAHGLRECLQCGAVLHLESGCAKMRCRCGFKFCFVCGTPNATCRCRAVRGHDFLSLKEVCSGWNSSSNSSSKEKDIVEAAAAAGGTRRQQKKRGRRGDVEEEEEEKTAAGDSGAGSASEEAATAANQQQRSSSGSNNEGAAATQKVIATTVAPASSLRKIVEPCNTARRVRSAAAPAAAERTRLRDDSKKQQPFVLNEEGCSEQQEGVVGKQQQTHLLNGNNSSSSSRSKKEQQLAGDKDSRNSSSSNSSNSNSSSSTGVHEKDGGGLQKEADTQQVSERSCTNRYIQPSVSNSSSKGGISNNMKGSKNCCSGRGKKSIRRVSTDSSWVETASSRSSSTTHSRRVSDATDSHSSTTSILGNNIRSSSNSSRNSQKAAFAGSSMNESSNTFCNLTTNTHSNSRRSNPGIGSSSSSNSNTRSMNCSNSSANVATKPFPKHTKRLREGQSPSAAAATRRRTR